MPTSPDTLADQRLYTEARLTEVACLDCLARVGVKKNSDHHTSIQWTGDATQACPEFARMAQRPEGRRVREGCGRMAASIESAARDGQVPVGAEDGW